MEVISSSLSLNTLFFLLLFLFSLLFNTVSWFFEDLVSGSTVYDYDIDAFISFYHSTRILHSSLMPSSFFVRLFAPLQGVIRCLQWYLIVGSCSSIPLFLSPLHGVIMPSPLILSTADESRHETVWSEINSKSYHLKIQLMPCNLFCRSNCSHKVVGRFNKLVLFMSHRSNNSEIHLIGISDCARHAVGWHVGCRFLRMQIAHHLISFHITPTSYHLTSHPPHIISPHTHLISSHLTLTSLYLSSPHLTVFAFTLGPWCHTDDYTLQRDSNRTAAFLPLYLFLSLLPSSTIW